MQRILIIKIRWQYDYETIFGVGWTIEIELDRRSIIIVASGIYRRINHGATRRLIDQTRACPITPDLSSISVVLSSLAGWSATIYIDYIITAHTHRTERSSTCQDEFSETFGGDQTKTKKPICNTARNTCVFV